MWRLTCWGGTAQIWQNLGSLQGQAGELEAACQTYAESLAAAVAQFGESSRWATAARWKQACFLYELGRKVRPLNREHRSPENGKGEDTEALRPGSIREMYFYPMHINYALQALSMRY